MDEAGYDEGPRHVWGLYVHTVTHCIWYDCYLSHQGPMLTVLRTWWRGADHRYDMSLGSLSDCLPSHVLLNHTYKHTTPSESSTTGTSSNCLHALSTYWSDLTQSHFRSGDRFTQTGFDLFFFLFKSARVSNTCITHILWALITLKLSYVVIQLQLSVIGMPLFRSYVYVGIWWCFEIVTNCKPLTHHCLLDGRLVGLLWQCVGLVTKLSLFIKANFG